MLEAFEAPVWVVAGCLFEVSLRDRSEWMNPGPEVTLVGEGFRGSTRHLRFRAEAPGATAGDVELRFGRGGEVRCVVVVRIVPETPPTGALQARSSTRTD